MAGDIEDGEGGGDFMSVRVKTAGDGREYKVSSVRTATVAQVLLLFVVRGF